MGFLRSLKGPIGDLFFPVLVFSQFPPNPLVRAFMSIGIFQAKASGKSRDRKGSSRYHGTYVARFYLAPVNDIQLRWLSSDGGHRRLMANYLTFLPLAA
jgi:hypothetical protein